MAYDKGIEIEIVEDENGDLLIPFPNGFLDELGWKIGDDIDFNVLEDGSIELSKHEDDTCESIEDVVFRHFPEVEEKDDDDKPDFLDMCLCSDKMQARSYQEIVKGIRELLSRPELARQDGCRYCEHRPDSLPLFENENVAVSHAYGRMSISDKRNMIGYDIDINFCPMCGRPLRGY